jgi:hypothetical protein
MRVQYRGMQFIDLDAASRPYFTISFAYVSKVPIPEHYHMEKYYLLLQREQRRFTLLNAKVMTE